MAHAFWKLIYEIVPSRKKCGYKGLDHVIFNYGPMDSVVLEP